MGGMACMASPSWAFRSLAKKFEIGATCILWGYNPDDLEQAIHDISELGFHGFETFGQTIEEWETNRGGLHPLIQKYDIPIISAFCSIDVLNPSKTDSELEKLVKWAKLLKKNGGRLIEFSCAHINREGYDYREHKKNIIESMNTYAKAVTDLGLTCALHQHTSTPIETQEEVYFAMENVDTKYMKFGPDVGQLKKGGGDPVKIVGDFMPLIEHMHLKDYEGGKNGHVGYVPLGEGKVDIKKILGMVEEEKDHLAGRIMFELDPDTNPDVDPPNTPYEAAKISRDYLQNLGYKFND